MNEAALKRFKRVEKIYRRAPLLLVVFQILVAVLTMILYKYFFISAAVAGISVFATIPLHIVCAILVDTYYLHPIRYKMMKEMGFRANWAMTHSTTILEVYPDSAASVAGVQVGDKLIGLGDCESSDFDTLLRELPKIYEKFLQAGTVSFRISRITATEIQTEGSRP